MSITTLAPFSEVTAGSWPELDEFGRELDPLFYTKANALVADDYRKKLAGLGGGLRLPSLGVVHFADGGSAIIELDAGTTHI